MLRCNSLLVTLAANFIRLRGNQVDELCTTADRVSMTVACACLCDEVSVLCTYDDNSQQVAGDPAEGEIVEEPFM